MLQSQKTQLEQEVLALSRQRQQLLHQVQQHSEAASWSHQQVAEQLNAESDALRAKLIKLRGARSSLEAEVYKLKESKILMLKDIETLDLVAEDLISEVNELQRRKQELLRHAPLLEERGRTAAALGLVVEHLSLQALHLSGGDAAAAEYEEQRAARREAPAAWRQLQLQHMVPPEVHSGWKHRQHLAVAAARRTASEAACATPAAAASAGCGCSGRSAQSPEPAQDASPDLKSVELMYAASWMQSGAAGVAAAYANQQLQQPPAWLPPHGPAAMMPEAPSSTPQMLSSFASLQMLSSFPMNKQAHGLVPMRANSVMSTGSNAMPPTPQRAGSGVSHHLNNSRTSSLASGWSLVTDATSSGLLHAHSLGVAGGQAPYGSGSSQPLTLLGGRQHSLAGSPLMRSASSLEQPGRRDAPPQPLDCAPNLRSPQPGGDGGRCPTPRLQVESESEPLPGRASTDQAQWHALERARQYELRSQLLKLPSL